ncbi:unnamed protein product, partial [Mesorhabditis belari]|uniref:Calponin-homology (CH) domain-containing protein n=1 Tax=Mesorhabditis belari TaxID=2138241 RepID=A0AAF3JA20_9BILA
MDPEELEKKRAAMLERMEARQKELKMKKEARLQPDPQAQVMKTPSALNKGPYHLEDVLNLSAISMFGVNEKSFAGLATSTPYLARAQLAGSNRSINSADLSTIGFAEPRSIDDELHRQFMALASWGNTVMKSDILGIEVELDDVKAKANKCLEEMLTQRRNIETAANTRPYADWAQSRALDEYREKCKNLFTTKKIEQQMKSLVASGAVHVHPDKRIYLDIELQMKILYILLSFHPFWLHMGFELIFGKKITIKKGQSIVALISRFCRDSLFTNDKILKYKKATQGGSGNLRLMTATGVKMMHEHILHKLMMFFVFVEEAKKTAIIVRAPGMFGRKSEYKELKDVFAELSRLFLQSSMIMPKLLKKEGFNLSFIQPFYEFYVYRITKFDDVGDGIVLGRIVEYLLGMESNSLMSKLRSPSGDRIRKIGNLNTILTTLQAHNVDIGSLTAASIVGLNRISIIELMWRLVGFYMQSNNLQPIPVAPLETVEPNKMKEFRKELIKRCQDFAEKVGVKVDGFRSIRDGTVFAELWRVYTDDQPSLNEFDGEDLWSKVYNAAHSVLGVPQCVVMEDARSLTLFTVGFLKALEEYRNDHALRASGVNSEPASSEPATSEPATSEPPSPAISTASEFGATYTVAEGLIQEEDSLDPTLVENDVFESEKEDDPAHCDLSTNFEDESTLIRSCSEAEKTNGNISPIVESSTQATQSDASTEGQDVDLYQIDIDQMAALKDEENAKLAEREPKIEMVEKEEVGNLVTDEEMNQMEAGHADEGLVMERIEIDGETSFGWRESEPEDDEPPNVAKTSSIIDTPQLYYNTKATDFDKQYLPDVPQMFDFKNNLDDEEAPVESEENKENVPHQTSSATTIDDKENVDHHQTSSSASKETSSATTSTISNLPPLPNFDLSHMKNTTSNYADKSVSDPMLEIYAKMKALEREQTEMTRLIQALKVKAENALDN